VNFFPNSQYLTPQSSQITSNTASISAKNTGLENRISVKKYRTENKNKQKNTKPSASLSDWVHSQWRIIK
jgi:hypothetical protein